MQQGEVKERGTHEELIALGGIYKNLVSRQLVAEEIEKDNEDGSSESEPPLWSSVRENLINQTLLYS